MVASATEQTFKGMLELAAGEFVKEITLAKEQKASIRSIIKESMSLLDREMNAGSLGDNWGFKGVLGLKVVAPWTPPYGLVQSVTAKVEEAIALAGQAKTRRYITTLGNGFELVSHPEKMDMVLRDIAAAWVSTRGSREDNQFIIDSIANRLNNDFRHDIDRAKMLSKLSMQYLKMRLRGDIIVIQLHCLDSLQCHRRNVPTTVS